ncbi:guanylate kinase [Thermosporothrix hazakensis]|uniref:Guanylate kinase n=2 Tax=Thermosporothrix TaxID=768650 RepID=A0A326UA75_THEHA|nr:guanylate kinase [Thermosporothrix hazakensis]PZW33076.1 guanylate kinase [Thermosporothrix hazakensis]BBH91054.1 guanylate kinase [Thermosporothrix sp. COM3]GCE49107.1 guanylate kinase [Thermosporothrix hazakensis]
MRLETGDTLLQPREHSSLVPPLKQGLLFVLSAPSGTGKDTVIKALKDQGMGFHVVASVTTRAPRVGESEGNPYYFVSNETFERMVENDELLEYANVHGNWYGQPIQPIKENLRNGRDVLLKIDVQGAATVRRKVPGAIFIFLVPGSLEELVYRLTNRQTETEEQVQRRLTDARKELAQQIHYDYIVENRQGHLDKAVERVRSIIIAEHCRTNPHYVEL